MIQMAFLQNRLTDLEKELNGCQGKKDKGKRQLGSLGGHIQNIYFISLGINCFIVA